MDAMIAQTLGGMLSTFDHITVEDPALKAEIAAYRAEMHALGEGAADVMAFMTALQSSGLMARQSDLITRATMAQQRAAQSQSAPAPSQAAAPQRPTVSQFLEQYRAGAAAARAHGFQPRAVAAYERLFGIADRTTDLMQMHLLLEEEGHLRALTAEAMRDINTLHYDITDPNDLGSRARFQALIKLSQTYTTEAALAYATERVNQRAQQGGYRHNFMIRASAQLALQCIGYGAAKGLARVEPAKYAGQFVAARQALVNTYQALDDLFGLDFEAMLEDPWLRHWMLSPQNLDSTGRVTRCLDVRNLDFYREVLFDEALTDLSDIACLRRTLHHPFFPSLDVEHNPAHRAADEAIQRHGKARLSDRYFHGYEQRVGDGA